MRKINKYQIFTELQHGPITRVYKAVQPELQRVVLVKQLNPDLVPDQELVDRFKQEGLILAQINSPQVITIFDFGFDEGVPYLVTEFVEGNTLAELIRQHGPLPWDISLFILQQLAQGLNAIHGRNIIHQDIKPENIFVSDQGNIKLGDLGFSVALDQADRPIEGTPAYLPPEIVLGSPVDIRSDLYSLGLVGYEMLTGENPFNANDIQTVLNRIVNMKPMNVHAVRSEVPELFSNMIEKLMRRNPEERFLSANELYRELDNFKTSYGIRADKNSFVSYLQQPAGYQISRIILVEKSDQPFQKLKKRKKAMLLAGLVVVSILLILLIKLLDYGFSLLQRRPTTTTTVEQSYSQSEIQHNIPLTPGDTTHKNLTPSSIMTNEATKTIKPSNRMDTLEALAWVDTKKDTIVITSDPRAVVFRHGDSLGMTPFRLFIGSNKEPLGLEFKTPGFPAIPKTVTETDLSVQKFHINLWKEVGYLDISIRPWGVIWIDGDSIDVSPINRLLILSPGNHKLIIRHPSLRSVTEFIYVALGETLRKNIQLRPGS